MLHNVSSQQVFHANDDLDDLVKVEGLEIESLQDPGKSSLRTVRDDDDLQAASEEGAVEEILGHQIPQGFVLAPLPVQYLFQHLVVQGDSHLKAGPRKRISHSGMTLCRGNVLLAESVPELPGTF